MKLLINGEELDLSAPRVGFAFVSDLSDLIASLAVNCFFGFLLTRFLDLPPWTSVVVLLVLVLMVALEAGYSCNHIIANDAGTVMREHLIRGMAASSVLTGFDEIRAVAVSGRRQGNPRRGRPRWAYAVFLVLPGGEITRLTSWVRAVEGLNNANLNASALAAHWGVPFFEGVAETFVSVSYDWRSRRIKLSRERWTVFHELPGLVGELVLTLAIKTVAKWFPWATCGSGRSEERLRR